MYSHGVDPQGPIYVERLTTLPDFNLKTDPGRLIVTLDKNAGFLGTINEWVPISLYNKCVKLKHLDLGFGSEQINASVIPACLPNLDDNLSFTNSNIQEIINESWNYFRQIKAGTFFDDKSINKDKINLDPANNGLVSTDLYVYDAFLDFGTSNNEKVLDDVLMQINDKTGMDIKLGRSITVKDFTISEGDSITDAITKLADHNLNLIASNIECDYYDSDPYGKSYCVRSDVQTALNTIQNQLYVHKIIDHLDVQHDWGMHCGQYLGTYGGRSDNDTNTTNRWLDDTINDGDDCCNGNPHLPLAFKTIQAEEVEVVIHRPDCLCNPDMEMHEKMSLQCIITAIIKQLCTLHPIGSVFITYDKTNPKDLFKCGEWEYIGSRFLLGCDSPNDKAGKTGGEETHLLTIDEMPSHNHTATVHKEPSAHSHQITIQPNGEHDHTASCSTAGNHIHSVSVSKDGAHTHTGSTAIAGEHNHSGNTSNAGEHSHSGSTNEAGEHTHTANAKCTGKHSHCTPIEKSVATLYNLKACSNSEKKVDTGCGCSEVVASEPIYSIRDLVNGGETNKSSDGNYYTSGSGGKSIPSHTSGIVPLSFIPAGTKNFVLCTYGGTADDDIQLFTADGYHLSGTPLSDNNWYGKAGNRSQINPNTGITTSNVNSNFITTGNGFKAGASYRMPGNTSGVSNPIIGSFNNPSSFVLGNDNGYTKSEVNSGTKQTFYRKNNTLAKMVINYSGDYDHIYNGGIGQNPSANTAGTKARGYEFVHIDVVTEDLYVFVVGDGSFSGRVWWDYMPQAATKGTGSMSFTYNLYKTSEEGSDDASVTVESDGNHSHTISTSKSGKHDHTLTTSSAGGHTHDLQINPSGEHFHSVTVDPDGNHNHNITVNSNGEHDHNAVCAKDGEHTHNITINNTGGSQPHNNMPPYVKVHMWVRTA